MTEAHFEEMRRCHVCGDATTKKVLITHQQDKRLMSVWRCAEGCLPNIKRVTE